VFVEGPFPFGKAREVRAEFVFHRPFRLAAVGEHPGDALLHFRQLDFLPEARRVLVQHARADRTRLVDDRLDAGSLRGKGNRRPANFAKTAVVAENILGAAQDGAHDERIISVADLRNRIWDDVCFLGHITKRKRSFLL
jgi:hypothetical protein